MDKDKLNHLLTCPICISTIQPPTFQCPNGHLICEQCLSQLEISTNQHICPECHTPYGTVRIQSLVADLLSEMNGEQQRIKDDENFCRRFSLGPYVTIAEKTNVKDGYSELESEVMESLIRGAYFEVVETKKCVYGVKGKLSSGGYVTLMNENGCQYARPISLGIYKTIASTVITEDIHRMSPRKETLDVGVYVEVVEARLIQEENRVRGRLSSGGWISIVDTFKGRKWVECIDLGVYVTVAEKGTAVMEECQSSSKIKTMLKPGDFVQVVEIKYLPEFNRIWGKLKDDEGWISLVNTSGGYEWARMLPLGVYKIFNATDVTEQIGLESDVTEILAAAEYVEIIEMQYLSEEQLIRGKLISNGWITLYDSFGNGHRKKAKPVPLGVYFTVETTSVTEEVCIRSGIKCNLNAGRFRRVVEVWHLPMIQCVRGRLANGGWISLVNTENGHKWAKPIPLGVYETINDSVSVTEKISHTSTEIKKLGTGVYIELTDIQCVPKDQQLRGKLASGGWISIYDTSVGYGWAQPVPLSVYKTIAQKTPVTETTLPDSLFENLSAGEYLEIVELKLLLEFQRVKGMLACGGWISLIDTCSGQRWANPLPLGIYKIVAEIAVVTKGVHGDTVAVKKLKMGDCIKVVEIIYLQDEERVRGRLTDKAWVSLVNTSNNFTWAKPMNISKEEKRVRNREHELENIKPSKVQKKVSSYSCDMCGRSFGSADSAQQHYRDAHEPACDQCDRVFCSTQALRQHMRSKHNYK